MIYQVMNIKAETYEEPAKLYLYLLEKSPEIGIDKRPLIFICPGGGYGMTSDREAEAIALQFVAAGFHAAATVWLRPVIRPPFFRWQQASNI